MGLKLSVAFTTFTEPEDVLPASNKVSIFDQLGMMLQYVLQEQRSMGVLMLMLMLMRGCPDADPRPSLK